MSHYIVKRTELEPRTSDVWGLQSDINRLFDAFMSPLDTTETRAVMSPKLDVAELKDKFEIKAELPGMDEKDIELSLDDGLLTISGEKKAETEEKDKGYYLKECSYGTFSRSIRLPDNIADDKIEAKFKKGVLTIDLPKKEVIPPKSRKIAIK
ncbi:MAG: Hsp20/alpha crystallin family protein [Alphaproteobacteria bacterium]|jgi:HSP20 family protein|nr:Hsp20/alpha crystallin family protein [Alphaproteobacteria bacterium]